MTHESNPQARPPASLLRLLPRMVRRNGAIAIVGLLVIAVGGCVLGWEDNTRLSSRAVPHRFQVTFNPATANVSVTQPPNSVVEVWRDPGATLRFWGPWDWAPRGAGSNEVLMFFVILFGAVTLAVSIVLLPLTYAVAVSDAPAESVFVEERYETLANGAEVEFTIRGGGEAFEWTATGGQTQLTDSDLANLLSRGNRGTLTITASDYGDSDRKTLTEAEVAEWARRALTRLSVTAKTELAGVARDDSIRHAPLVDAVLRDWRSRLTAP